MGSRGRRAALHPYPHPRNCGNLSIPNAIITAAPNRRTSALVSHQRRSFDAASRSAKNVFNASTSSFVAALASCILISLTSLLTSAICASRRVTRSGMSAYCCIVVTSSTSDDFCEGGAQGGGRGLVQRFALQRNHLRGGNENAPLGWGSALGNKNRTLRPYREAGYSPACDIPPQFAKIPMAIAFRVFVTEG